MSSSVEFYTVRGIKYAHYFPRYFAEYHKEQTGPVECLNCAIHGCIDGIFIGYCLNCAFVYKGYRGIGMAGENVINEYTANKTFFERKVTFVPPETIFTAWKRWKLLKILGILGIIGVFVGWMGWLWFYR